MRALRWAGVISLALTGLLVYVVAGTDAGGDPQRTPHVDRGVGEVHAVAGEVPEEEGRRGVFEAYIGL